MKEANKGYALSREEYWATGSDFQWLQTAFDFAELKPPTPRSDQHSMVWPIFALAARDMSELHFEDSRSRQTIDILPGYKVGRATIEDRDLLLFAISAITPQTEANPIDWLSPRRIKFRLGDYFAFVGIEKPGSTQVKKVEAALERLQATRLKTTLSTNDVRETEAFSLITSYKITEKKHRRVGRGHAIEVEIELCRWLHNAVLAKKELLTMDRGYFKLRPLERRLYELARKFCGHQHSWTIGHDRLFELIGSRQAKKHIMAELREIVRQDPLPKYSLQLTKETLIVRAKTAAALVGSIIEHNYDE